MNRAERGSTGVNLIIGLSISGALAYSVAQISEHGLNAQRSVGQRAERDAILHRLATTLDCQATLGAIDPANPGSACESTSDNQVGPWLHLHRRTARGNAALTAPPNEHGFAKLGDWAIRVSCSRSEQSLIVAVARLGTSAQPTFRRDPLTKFLDSWKVVFGGRDGRIPLCFDAVAPTPVAMVVARSPEEQTIRCNDTTTLSFPVVQEGGALFNGTTFTPSPGRWVFSGAANLYPGPNSGSALELWRNGSLLTPGPMQRGPYFWNPDPSCPWGGTNLPNCFMYPLGVALTTTFTAAAGDNFTVVMRYGNCSLNTRTVTSASWATFPPSWVEFRRVD